MDETETTAEVVAAPVVVEEQKAWTWVSADGVTWWPAYLGGQDHNIAGWTNSVPWPGFTADLLVGGPIPSPERQTL